MKVSAFASPFPNPLVLALPFLPMTSTLPDAEDNGSVGNLTSTTGRLWSQTRRFALCPVRNLAVTGMGHYY